MYNFFGTTTTLLNSFFRFFLYKDEFLASFLNALRLLDVPSAPCTRIASTLPSTIYISITCPASSVSAAVLFSHCLTLNHVRPPRCGLSASRPVNFSPLAPRTDNCKIHFRALIPHGDDGETTRSLPFFKGVDSTFCRYTRWSTSAHMVDFYCRVRTFFVRHRRCDDDNFLNSDASRRAVALFFGGCTRLGFPI